MAKAFPSKFPLNEKADASECFDDVLTMIQNNLVPPEMRDKQTGSLLHYLIGLDLTVHINCGCGKVDSRPQNNDQYTVMVMSQQITQAFPLARDADDSANLEQLKRATGQFPQTIKAIYPHQIVCVEELEHYKKCKKSKATTCSVSTNKEPEVLTFDIKWFEV